MSTRIPKRGAIYYVQQAVPLDLRDVLGAKQIWKSLETKEYEEAKTRHLKAKIAFREQFKRLREQRADAVQTPRPVTKSVDLSPEQLAARQQAREEWEQEQWEYQLANPLPEYDDLTPEEQRVQDAVDAAREQWERQQRDEREFWRQEKAAEAAAKAKEPTAVTPLKSPGTALSDIVERWAQVRKPAPKTIDRMKQVVAWFEDSMGRIPVEDITADDVHRWTDKLLASDITPANARTKLANLKTLLNNAVTRARVIKVNPAAGVSIDVKKDPEEDVQPFDRPALQAIFGSPIYTRNERPEAGAGDAAYWLPLLALFSGARLNELGQLRPKDIAKQPYVDKEGQEQEAWCIRLVADKAEGLKLKNRWSARRFPVHPELIRLGFLDYVEAARANDHTRLFPALRPDKYAHITANWSKWFGRYLRGTINVTDDRMRFHSFRHAFKDYAREAEIAEDVSDAITGHKGQSVARRYGNTLAYPLRPMVNAMTDYRVTGLDMPAPPPPFQALNAAE